MKPSLKKLICFFIFLTVWVSYANDTLTIANKYLEQSNLKKAAVLFENLAESTSYHNDPHVFIDAKIGLAKTFTDLGTYHLSIKVLEEVLHVLTTNEPSNYATIGKVHELLANNYEYLFLLNEYLLHTEKFIENYRLAFPKVQVYEALYHAYLGGYYNFKFDIKKAYENSSKAIEIVQKNKLYAQAIDVVKVYESHCFTLRNYSEDINTKQQYLDTLKQKILQKYPSNTLQRAKSLISISSFDLDHTFNTLSRPNKLSLFKRDSMVQNAIKNYKKAIGIYNHLNISNHDYLPRYYNLQGWLLYGNKDYKKALEVTEKGIERYATTAFLNKGFVANNFRVINNLRFKMLILQQLKNTSPSPVIDKAYLNTLLLFENLWKTYVLEQIKNKTDYVSNMYNQAPYKFLFEYYAQLYMDKKDAAYLHKAHEYEEKSKYTSLLSSLSLNSLQQQQRNQLTQLNKNINLLLDRYFYASFINSPKQQDLKFEIEKAIKQFDTLKKQALLNKNFKIKDLTATQNNLADDQAIISYNYIDLTGNNVYAEIITKNKAEIIYIKKPEANQNIDYGKLTNDLVASLKNNDIIIYKEHAYLLFENLFKPVLAQLPPSIKNIEILPFADIENLPFDLLLTHKTSTLDYRKLPYLAKEYHFNYALSASIKQLNIENKNQENTGISIFNPVFKNTTLQELPYATTFSKKLSQDLDATLYNNKTATIQNFKKALATANIVTLISHGASSSSFETNEKGIYLQDGFFNIDSIYNITTNTNFLLLAACETGKGFKDRGEGNINLVRAFSSIGVKSILNTNWEIDEKTSLNILQSFFKYTQQGLYKSQALNKAKMDYLQSCTPRYANPIYWAGLNIVGDDSPMIINNANPWHASYSWWIVALIPVLIIVFKFKKTR